MIFYFCIFVCLVNIIISIVTKENVFFGTRVTYKDHPKSFYMNVIICVFFIIFSVVSLFLEE